MSQQIPHIETYLLSNLYANDTTAAAAWTADLLDYLQNYQLPAQCPAQAFPLEGETYLAMLDGSAFFRRVLRLEPKKEEGAASQTAPSPTAAKNAHDQL